MTEVQVRCLGDGVAGVFSDERIAELGLNGEQLTSAYVNRSTLALGDDYDITDDEASEVVDRALDCLDWRLALAEIFAAEGLSQEQASCFASEISDEGIRASIESGFISESEDDLGIAEPEALEAIQACANVREMLFQTFVEEGLSEQSARCVADGLPDEVVDMMLGGGEPEDEEAALEMMGELMALQNRCLTPDELEFMGGSGFQGGPIPEGSIGTGDCPPADGSGPAVLYFDGPQPMCLDPSRQYTAVLDTTAGEIRITLDMVNTPITANNFAVLALNHYYDDTLLFRTDPGIGIIQGGSPHTNSPSDPGPGYTIPDEGTGFTYEPGQIVMGRTAAPNSASAQFFFAVNENTALLNSQGTYVVFGQMDDASLAVAEAILASHVDQPDNRLGGAPEPPVFVNSVSIEETG
ncbi:MAG: peptidylprolyl isomerase [bacterium]|nr:peptidylprolyl isomerase [bacterium]